MLIVCEDMFVAVVSDRLSQGVFLKCIFTKHDINLKRWGSVCSIGNLFSGWLFVSTLVCLGNRNCEEN